MIVRAAVAADADAYVELFDQVAAELVYIGTEPGYDRDAYRRRFLNNVANPPPRTCLIVATDDDGRLAGHAGVYPDETYGAVLGMLVAKSQRGRGYGRALLDRLCDWARENGIERLSLKVFPHNEPARALYRAAGFAEVRRFERDRPRKDGELWDTILMQKDLGGASSQGMTGNAAAK